PAHYSRVQIDRMRAEFGDAAADALARARVYQNDLYEVALYRDEPFGLPALVHLSIKRRDRAPVRDWRHFQRIKNELLGPEHEAVELFPAEGRLVDAANQYHLWGFDDPAFRFPFGFADRLVSDASPTGGRQRPTS
ncbi:MAG: hypothetical protein KKA97_10445, partial [Actinobacteria bacterium]|nr:hypothetical protein [Actinomycetota bacterium]